MAGRSLKKLKLSDPYAGMGSQKGASKEVNPSFSVTKTPVAKPAGKKNVQINPTFSAGNSQTKSGARLIAARTRVNPTFAVAQAKAETSKGQPSKKLVARKSRVGKPMAAINNPLKPNLDDSANRLYALKTKNSTGSKVNATGPDSRYDEENVNSHPATPKMTKGNFKGTKVQGNAKKKATIVTPSKASSGNFSGTKNQGKPVMTVKRLARLGF